MKILLKICKGLLVALALTMIALLYWMIWDSCFSSCSIRHHISTERYVIEPNLPLTPANLDSTYTCLTDKSHKYLNKHSIPIDFNNVDRIIDIPANDTLYITDGFDYQMIASKSRCKTLEIKYWYKDYNIDSLRQTSRVHDFISSKQYMYDYIVSELIDKRLGIRIVISDDTIVEGSICILKDYN